MFTLQRWTHRSLWLKDVQPNKIYRLPKYRQRWFLNSKLCDYQCISKPTLSVLWWQTENKSNPNPNPMKLHSAQNMERRVWCTCSTYNTRITSQQMPQVQEQLIQKKSLLQSWYYNQQKSGGWKIGANMCYHKTCCKENMWNCGKT